MMLVGTAVSRIGIRRGLSSSAQEQFNGTCAIYNSSNTRRGRTNFCEFERIVNRYCPRSATLRRTRGPAGHLLQRGYDFVKRELSFL